MSRRVFTDSDEAAASMSGSGIEFALLGPQQREWTLVEARLGDIVAGAGETGAAFGATGATAANVYSFLFPFTHSPRWVVNGQIIAPDALTCFAPGADHVAAIGDPVEWGLLQMAPEAFEPIFAASRGHDFSRPSPVAIFNPSADAFADLTSAVRTAIQCARTRSDLIASQPVRDNLRKVLLGALLNVFPSRVSAEPLPYRGLRRRTQELLRAYGETPVYVTDLVAYLSISERSLRRFFNEVFGTSPAHYLRLRRFHQARRALRDARHVDTSVTSVSTAFGFFDLGRFASDYRALFGEFPSQTLRNARRRT